MIGFAGLSHLGIVSSLAAAWAGFPVTAYDSRPERVALLKEGRLPLSEPGLEEALKSCRSRISFTSDAADLKACDLIYFSIDISTDEENESDLSGLTELIQCVTPHLKAGTMLVVLSQVPPGFTRKLSRAPETQNFPLFYQVETLIFGQAWERATKPERIIVGTAMPDSELPKKYMQFLNLFNCPVLTMRYESAELAKISINFCLAASLSAANTLAEICEAVGADWFEIVPALRLDKRIGPHSYLNAGLGIAGGNLERDLVTLRKLSGEWGTDAGVADAFLANSRYRRDWALRVLYRELLCKKERPTIAVYGLAYKPDTDSVKNSPALELIHAVNGARVKVYDPQAVLPKDFSSSLQRTKTALEACDEADALVIMTPWKEFYRIDGGQLVSRMRGRVVIDPWGVLKESLEADPDFSYFRLGTCAAAASAV